MKAVTRCEERGANPTGPGLEKEVREIARPFEDFAGAEDDGVRRIGRADDREACGLA